MPKEQIRKRGKRKTKTDEFEAVAPAAAPAPSETVAQAEEAAEAAASGIHPSRLAFLQTGVRPPPPPKPEGEEENAEEENGVADWTRGPREESEYPFGVLDPDVKAYFRNVEEQIKDWEGVGSVGEEREDRQIFLASVLSELRGHELQVATDPDTAVVLERLLPSLNDWGRRVIGDAIGEQWETLLRHRFGSHVAQTWLTLAAGTLDREARDIFPAQHHEQAKKPEDGVLPTMGDIVTTLVTCIKPTLPTLLTSAHASPPVRLLLLVLTPNRALPSLDAAEGGEDLVRSKRSGKWRKNQDVKGKSILGEEKKSKKEKRALPAAVAQLRRDMRSDLMERVKPVEWQSMGVDKVGSAAVQLLLEVEVDDGDAETPGSLLDIITEGLVTDKKQEAQPYLTSLQVSSTGTRLFEALLRLSPDPIFSALWKTYFIGKIGKLSQHPYANFVVARGVARLDAKAVRKCAAEVATNSGGRGLIKTARTGVLLALIERATVLADADTSSSVEELIVSATDAGDKTLTLVPAMMALKTIPMYEAILAGEDEPSSEAEGDVDAKAEAEADAMARRSAWENRRQRKPQGALDPNVQGCLLLQALVTLPSTMVLDSLVSLPIEQLLTYAKSPIASRLLDATMSSPPKYRRKLLLKFMGKYNVLAMDRLGSRVAEAFYAAADGFMKEKIAKSLLKDATTLAADQYGRFLARKLDLQLLARREAEWREAHIGVKHHFAHQLEGKQPAAAPVETEEEKLKREKKERKERKRKEKEGKVDEIDDLFAGAERKKRKLKQ